MIDSRFFDKIGSKDLNEIKEGIQYLLSSPNDLEIEEIEMVIPVIEPYLQSPIPSLKNMVADVVQKLATIKSLKSRPIDETGRDTANPKVEKNQPELECGICQTIIGPEEKLTFCNECKLPFHEECWKENLGCSAYGCPNVNILKVKAERAVTPKISSSEPLPTHLPKKPALMHPETGSFPTPAKREDPAAYASEPSFNNLHAETQANFNDFKSNTTIGSSFSGAPITWLEWATLPVGMFLIPLDLFVWGILSLLLCLMMIGYCVTRTKTSENTFILGLSLGIASGGFMAGFVAGISGAFKLF